MGFSELTKQGFGCLPVGIESLDQVHGIDAGLGIAELTVDVAHGAVGYGDAAAGKYVHVIQPVGGNGDNLGIRLTLTHYLQ